MKNSPSKTSSRKKTSAKVVESATQISTWENDPFSQAVPTDPPTLATPILRPVPQLGSTGPLPITINEPQPAPRQYNSGTPEFRYWTAAEALRRGGDFWARITGLGKWFTSVGRDLSVNLDAGEDFNAFYDRQNLDFFHGSVAGLTVFSGESPDVVCHELGHAVLDALRPQLFNAGFTETAAFHESFGDMSAILSALQLPSMRQDVLLETHGSLSRSSSLSRIAEQLGFAIQKVAPSAVEGDCLRNAANSFFYRDPATLPPTAPASTLSSEPHSFSRIFTGAFLDVLAGLLSVQADGNMPTDGQLLQVSENAARYLVAAVRTAAVVPDYYSQVAAAMVDASDPRDRNAVAGGFVHHGVLSLSAAVTAGSGVARVAAAAPVKPGKEPADLGYISVACAEYGLESDTLLVHATPEPSRLQASGAAFGVGSVPQVGSDKAAKDFVEDLLQLGRIDFGSTKAGVSAFAHPFAHSRRVKTHEIVKEGKDLQLRRLRFDCGFDCGGGCS
jgi:hypothetical protein